LLTGVVTKFPSTPPQANVNVQLFQVPEGRLLKFAVLVGLLSVYMDGVYVPCVGIVNVTNCGDWKYE
jgi:hypothetical protein